MIALVDCNNFYASCERVFNPKLNDRPIIVLSNNDGCVIARSNQAKALGITMGVPYFKVAALCKQKRVAVFSSNYTLYGDMSRRVMSLLQEVEKNVEVYSIDEAFIHFNGKVTQLEKIGCQIRQMLLKATGIPTSVGIAPTKTLAKVANYIAKKHSIKGVVELDSATEWSEALTKLSLNDIWGIGRGLAAKLTTLGIDTPLRLAQTSPKFIRQHLGVVGERIVYELNGIPCITQEIPAPRQQIIVSRSFGKKLTALADLLSATSHYVVRAFEKLREQDSFVSEMQIFVVYKAGKKEYALEQKAMNFHFLEPTDDTRLGLHAVNRCLQQLYSPNKIYKKSGVMLMNLTSPQQRINDLFISSNKSQNVMKVIDQINAKLGNDALLFAAQLKNKKWQMQANLRSPHYTSQWSELVLVR